MKNSKPILSAAVAVSAILGIGAASAADLAVKAMPYAAPAPAFSWTGCYLGGNVGYGWAPTKWNGNGIEFDSQTADGVVGGGQIGCDYQTGQWVFGIQAMFDGSDMKGDSHRFVEALGPNVFDQTRVSSFATLTGRIGYTLQPITLLYVKGGAAWVRDKHDECCLPPTPPTLLDDGFANVTRVGWTVGIGLEHMFQPNWSVFFEYDFIGLGTNAVNFSPTGPTTSPFVYNINQDVHTILVGINYRFLGAGGRQY
jgi:outer membrane immunogenic protein